MSLDMNTKGFHGKNQDENTIGIDDSILSVSLYSSSCPNCIHWWRRHNKYGNVWRAAVKCDAYPDGIPAEILEGKNDHKQPYTGDHGIQFEPKESK